MDHFTLIDYKIQDAGANQLLVMISGNQIYKTILARAFPGHFMSRTFEDRFSRYEWGTYIHGVDDQMRAQIEVLLALCKRHIFIQDDLTETFALSYHTEMTPFGGYARTEIGELVYSAKPYERAVTASYRANAAKLAEQMAGFTQQHPSYYRSSVVISVPARAGKSFDLPTELAHQVAGACMKTDGTAFVRKVRQTRPAKDCQTIQEKIDNVRGAFEVVPGAIVQDRDILLVDDIYQAGFTLNEVGKVLFEAGARSVFGLIATKTGRDL